MRILEVVTSTNVGGAEILVANLVDRLSDRGHVVDVAALSGHSTGDTELGAVLPSGYLTATPRNPSFRIVKRITRWAGLRRIIMAGCYDVVHAHCHLPNMYARLSSLGLPVPVVITLHSGTGDYWRYSTRVIERCLARRTAHVISVNEEQAAEYGQIFRRHRAGIQVIPNGISPTIRPKRVHSLSPRVFVAASRISPEKDIITLLKGFDLFVDNSQLDAELWIAGGSTDAQYEHEVRCVHDGLRYRHRVKFLGFVPDTPALLHQCDVFVHASVREAHPVSILEAASTGLPVVCTDLPSIRKIMGDCASYFRVRNHRELAFRLNDTYLRWQEYVATAKRLAPTVLESYSMDVCCRQYLDVLHRVTSSGNGGD